MAELLSKSVPEAELRNRSETGYDERILPDDLQADPLHLARYLFASHWVPGCSVVDFCCGLGYGSNILAAAGARTVLGVDVAASVVEAAERRYAGTDVRFICADAGNRLSIPQADVVVCFEGIEHIATPETLLENMTGCLGSEGAALISTPNAEQYPTRHSGNPYHLREYSRRDFEKVLSKYFGKVDLYFQWGSGDPYDMKVTFRNLSKLLVPIPIKRFMRSLAGAQHTGAPPSFAGADLSPHQWRPYPLRYLKLVPGLRHAQPSIWLAVCRNPISGAIR